MVEKTAEGARDALLHYRAPGHEGAYSALLQSVEHLFEYILELNLDDWTTYVMRNLHEPQQEGTTTSYRFGADRFCNYGIMEEDRPLAQSVLDLDALRRFHSSGQQHLCVELRACAKGAVYEWVNLCLHAVPTTTGAAPKLLITVRNINDSKLMKGIVDRFVYDSCDYFICLDAKNDSYVMFSGSDNGTPLPPTVCDSYSTEVVKYARAFVVEEDQDYTIQQMSLPYVLEQLDTRGEHVFYVGVEDERRGYTRKCLRYLYYDRQNSMVLLVRTDVTDVFLEEKQKNDRLRQALKEARTDFLTGLYNRMALESSIARLLMSPEVVSGAFFFVDVDDFKVINDTFGHTTGDRALVHIARSLELAFSDDCVLGRFGGDEFVAFCPHVCSWSRVEETAQSICCIFDDCPDALCASLACSVGISRYPEDGRTFEDLMRQADAALYRSKRRGKKQYSFAGGDDGDGDGAWPELSNRR